MRMQNTEEIKGLLNDLDFPASKEEIVGHVRRRGGPGTGAERALSALPLGDYASLQEVLRSVPTDPDPGRSEAERVSQQRDHRHAGLAEHMRDREAPPIADELGRAPGGRRS